MVAAGVAVAGNLAQGNWKGALGAAVGFIPGGKALASIASMSKVGTKVLTKVMSAQARAPGIGVSSRLFGSSQVGTRSGLLNRAGSAFKAGWGHQAVNQGKKGYVVFRYGFLKKPASNVSKYHITMGRAWRKW